MWRENFSINDLSLLIEKILKIKFEFFSAFGLKIFTNSNRFSGNLLGIGTFVEIHIYYNTYCASNKKISALLPELKIQNIRPFLTSAHKFCHLSEAKESVKKHIFDFPSNIKTFAIAEL